MDEFFDRDFIPQDHTWYRWRLNGAAVYLMKDGERWRSAFDAIPLENMSDDFGGPDEAAPPRNLPQTLTVGKGERVRLRPSLSEKPYLLTIPGKTTLLPGMETSYDVAFPPFLRFEFAAEAPVSPEPAPGLAPPEPPFIFSEAWFGSDTTDGFLCLSIPFRCITETGDASPGESGPSALIHGAIRIRNVAKTPVDLERLVVYTEPLNLYERRRCLYSDAVVLDASGDGDLTMNVAPLEGEGYRRIGAAKKTAVGNILVRRGAHFIKNLTSF